MLFLPFFPFFLLWIFHPKWKRQNACRDLGCGAVDSGSVKNADRRSKTGNLVSRLTCWRLLAGVRSSLGLRSKAGQGSQGSRLYIRGTNGGG